MTKNLHIIGFITALFAFTFSSAFGQYCTPRTSTTWSNVSEVSTTQAIGNIKNVTANTYGVFDFTNTHMVTVTPGSSFKLNLNTTQSGNADGFGVWIDWNNDGTFATSGAERVYVSSGYEYGLPVQVTVNVPTTALKGTKLRMRVMGGYYWYLRPCGFSNYQGDVEDYSIFVTYNDNAAMSSINAPLVECNGSAGNDVRIKYMNNGAEPLDTVTLEGFIKSKVGNIRTPIPAMTINTPSLNPGEVSAEINLFTYISGFKAGDTVCVWTKNPNNRNDSIPEDDTLCHVVLEGMKGKFSIGDTSLGHDFNTIAEAIDSLNERGAICDSVIFCLADTSVRTHYGQYLLKNIKGTSPTSPIIFTTIDTNKYVTMVHFDSCTADMNYIFGMEDISDIHFEGGIMFSALNSKAPNHATIFNSKEADNIYFRDISLTNSSLNSNSLNYSLINASDINGLSIERVAFTNGSNAIQVSNYSDVIIDSCTFRNMYNRAINLEKGSDVVVNKNTIVSSSTSTSGYAIALTESNNNLTVSYNTVLTDRNQWPARGIYMRECNALSGQSVLYNNVLNLGQPWSGVNYFGIFMNQVVGASLVYNTVALSGNNSNNSSLYSSGGTRNVAFNNVFSALISGYAINIPVAASIINADYNDLHSAGGTVGRQGSTVSPTLQDWQNRTGFGKNSVSVDPQFHKVSDNNLHVCNVNLFQAGTPISGITIDWDGDARDPQKPCIGADEFAPTSLFTLGNDYGLCTGDSTSLSAGKGLTGEIAIWQDGSTGNIIDTTRTLTIKAPGTYTATLLNACGVNVDSITIIAPENVVLSNDTNLCPDKTMPLDASIANGNMYSWSNGLTTPTITITSAGTYRVTTTDMWNCVSEDSVTITYSNAADLNVNDTIVCEGKPFGLFGGTNFGNGVSYVWTGCLDAQGNNNDNVFVDYDELYGSNDTIITCELTHNGCVTMDTCRVRRKPAPAITGLDVVVNGLSLFINKNASTGEDHNWNFGDSNSSVWGTPRYRYNNPGTYTVKYVNSNICGSVDTTFDVNMQPLSIQEVGADAELLVYPNPNNGNFTVNLRGVEANEVILRVTDASGRTLLNENYGSVHGELLRPVSIENNVSGVYILQLNIDGVIATHRITIQ